MSKQESLGPDRRKAMEVLIARAIEDIRVTSEVELLHECRNLFMSKVPFGRRAYAAAAILLSMTAYGAGPRDQGRRGRDGAGKGRPDGKAGRDGGREAKPGRDARDAKDSREGGRDGAARGDGRGARDGAARGGREQRVENEPRQDREPRERQAPAPRENRYLGEGVTLFVGAGRRQHFYPRTLLKMLSQDAGIDESRIGDIKIFDSYTFVVVDPLKEEEAIAALSGQTFRGRKLVANRARKKGEAVESVRGESGTEDRDARFESDVGDAGDGAESREPYRDDEDGDEYGPEGDSLDDGDELGGDEGDSEGDPDEDGR